MQRQRVVYNGIVFTRYPDSDRRHHRVYFWPTKTQRERGVGALHVEIYKSEIGPIPAGWHVHHRNGDSLDNRSENLEVLPPDEHAAHHASLNGGWGRQDEEHMERLRELAKAWHSSPEGRAWHSENGKRAWEGREKQEAGNCFGCGEPVRSYFPERNGRRWCSRACIAKWEYREGIGAVEKECAHCGTPFWSKSRGRARYCSRSCAARDRPRSESGRLEPRGSGDA